MYYLQINMDDDMLVMMSDDYNFVMVVVVFDHLMCMMVEVWVNYLVSDNLMVLNFYIVVNDLDDKMLRT